MKTFTITLLLSVLLVFTTASDPCTESFTLIAKSLSDFKDHFLSHKFNQLPVDIENMKKSTELVQENCGEFVTITPDIFSQDVKECSHAYTLVLGLVQDNIFNTLDDVSLFQDFPFIIEDIVSFLIQIGETDCLNQWRIKLGHETLPEIYEANEEVIIEAPLVDGEDESLGLFIPLYFEKEDQEETLSVFVADDEFTVDPDTEAGESDLFVFVDLYLEQEDQDGLSIYVPNDEFVVEYDDDDSLNGFLSMPEIIIGDETEGAEDNSLGVFIPLYFEKEDQEDTLSVYVEDDVIVDNVEVIMNEEGSLGLFIPLYFEKEDQEDTLSVFVSGDEITNEEDSVNMFLPMI